MAWRFCLIRMVFSRITTYLNVFSGSTVVCASRKLSSGVNASTSCKGQSYCSLPLRVLHIHPRGLCKLDRQDVAVPEQWDNGTALAQTRSAGVEVRDVSTTPQCSLCGSAFVCIFDNFFHIVLAPAFSRYWYQLVSNFLPNVR